jgi:hypothetical protein
MGFIYKEKLQNTYVQQKIFSDFKMIQFHHNALVVKMMEAI